MSAYVWLECPCCGHTRPAESFYEIDAPDLQESFYESGDEGDD